MDWVFLVGRVLFVALFLMSGSTIHLLRREQGIEYARMYNVPAPELLVPFSGLMAVLGGLSVVLGVWADLGALLLFVFLVVVAYYMHPFWKEEDAMQRANQMAHFQKNLSIAGAALVIFYVYNQLQGDAGLSLTDPLFGRVE